MTTSKHEQVWLWTIGPGIIEAWAKRQQIPVAKFCSAEQLIDFYGISNVMYFDSCPHTPEVAGRFAKANKLVLSLGIKSGGLEALGACPNLMGGIIDDLSSNMPGTKSKNVYTADSVGAFYRRLKACGSSLQLYGVIYTMNFNLDFSAYLSYIDVVSLWVWNSEHLAELDRHVERCREIFHGKPIILGFYLYEYGAPKPRFMPLDLVQFEFRKAREYVQAGLIEGYQVLGSYLVEELETPQARWVRDFLGER